jgi:hypothetical protein
MGETKERCGDHAPRNEIVARRDVETDRPADRNIISTKIATRKRPAA